MSIELPDEDFIGRGQEIAFFDEWLNSQEAPAIVYFHDALEEAEKKGGIGKTWLLRRLYQLAQQQYEHVVPVMVDFFNIEDRDGVVIVERLIKAIQAHYPHWIPEAFQRQLAEYRNAAQGRRAEAAGLRDDLGDTFAADLYRLQQDMQRDNTYILLFFDTFERIEHNPISAVLRSSQTFPDTYQSSRVRAIIAGRNEINWSHPNWTGREHKIIVRELAPFSYEETLQYLNSRLYHSIKDVPEEFLRALYERTEGRPILIGLVSDILNKQTRDLQSLLSASRTIFEASLLEEVNLFDSPSTWAIFIMAHIYHRFDEDLLSTIMNSKGLRDRLPPIKYRELQVILPTFSFIRHSASSGDFVLHDEMRRLVNKYCWEKQDMDRRIRYELSMLAIDYYTKLLKSKSPGVTLQQSYIVEMLFHKLFLDLQDGFEFFELHFIDALELHQRSFARLLLQELQKFTAQLPRELYLQMRLYEADLYRREDNTAASLSVLIELEDESAWAEQNRSELLYRQALTYMRMSRFSEAIPSAEACLQLEQNNRDKSRYAELLKMLGYIYRRMGQYEDAMRFYQESLIVHRSLDDQQEYANLLNNIANIQWMQGKLEEALRSCKLALRIRRDLVKQGEESEISIGLSQAMLGHIYHTLGDVMAEEHAYQEAFDIYARRGEKRGMAAISNRLGRIRMNRGDLEQALSYFQQAQRIARELDRETEIESYNQLGRLFSKEEKWQEAVDAFTQAIELARSSEAHFQVAENLLFLAVALAQLGQPFKEQIKEAKRIARQNDYIYLLARAGDFQGDIYYQQGEYQQAFRYYRIACRYMAMRPSLEFERLLRKLVDLMLEMPGSFLPGVIDSLLEYWYGLGLEKKHPQLLNACKEVSRHMIL
ncbi:tetratricopeptide repeat protein [Ktedonosporobacter rubrisoli]|uniref:Tetratricopeptide repeat protein n=1 Tax=Ktedonosporobacter rubrisoli TaxID=2509675 RepID=A0A4P6JX00_KTERU|nr:tetratricopeptide repeat protein [Ktedonosporobacter rubrisoli]QBD79923.1 tetratricopeptide repeat protein [Ktedonosporobacter rubrisoli]